MEITCERSDVPKSCVITVHSKLEDEILGTPEAESSLGQPVEAEPRGDDTRVEVFCAVRHSRAGKEEDGIPSLPSAILAVPEPGCPHQQNILINRRAPGVPADHPWSCIGPCGGTRASFLSFERPLST